MNRHLSAWALAAAALIPAFAQAQAPEGKVYAPGEFDSLAVDGAGQVRVVQGDRDEVFVPGDAAAQEEVGVRLVGSRMQIDLPGGWKFWNNSSGTQVEVRVRHLVQLTMSGANDVSVPGPFSGDRLAISLAGPVADGQPEI